MLLLILVFQRQRDRSGSDRGIPGWHSIKRSGISRKAHQRRRYPDYLLIWSRASLNRLDLRFRSPRSNSHGFGAPVFGRRFWLAARDAMGPMSLVPTTGEWRVLRGDPFSTRPPLFFWHRDTPPSVAVRELIRYRRRTRMRALSLWQPWASLWCSSRKVHETRH